jgi:hypothetical protein
MMVFRRSFGALLGVVVLAVVPAPGMAQVGGSGSIHGNVLDSSGAVLPPT